MILLTIYFRSDLNIHTNSSNETDDLNSIIGDISTIFVFDLITIKKDLDTITSILHQTFELPPFKRDYMILHLER